VGLWALEEGRDWAVGQVVGGALEWGPGVGEALDGATVVDGAQVVGEAQVVGGVQVVGEELDGATVAGEALVVGEAFELVLVVDG